MTDLARPGSTIGGYTPIGGGKSGGSTFSLNLNVAAPKPAPAPSLFEQVGDVLRGLPGGLATFAGKGLQTVAAPLHIAYDAITDPVHLAQVDSFGDFTDQYLPLPDMMVRSMGHTVARLRHPSRYWKAVQEGHIVGTVLEDAGNAAIVLGGVSKALGSVAQVGAAGELAAATDAAIAEGGMKAGGFAEWSARRAVGKLERGSGIARVLEKNGMTEAAAKAERAGSMLTQGRHVLDTVATQPFPLLRYASGKLGEGLAPVVEQAVAERLGRPYEIPRTGNKPLRLSEVMRSGLVGTKVGESAMFSRLTPQGRAFEETTTGPLRDNVHQAQRDTSQVGQVIEDVNREFDMGLSRKDNPTYDRLSRAAGMEAGGEYAQQLDRWTQEYPRVIGTADEAAWKESMARELAALTEGAPHAATIATPEAAMTLVQHRLGLLPDGETAFIDRVTPELQRLAEVNQQMGAAGVGSRETLPEETGADVLPIEVQRQRTRLERQRDTAQRAQERAYDRMTDAQLRERFAQIAADDLPDAPRPSDVFRRGRATEQARQRTVNAGAALRKARASLEKVYTDYEQAVQRGADNVEVLRGRLTKAMERVDKLKAHEAELRKTQKARISSSTVPKPPDQPPPAGPPTGPPSPDTPPAPTGGGAAPAAAPTPAPMNEPLAVARREADKALQAQRDAGDFSASTSASQGGDAAFSVFRDFERSVVNLTDIERPAVRLKKPIENALSRLSTKAKQLAVDGRSADEIRSVLTQMVEATSDLPQVFKDRILSALGDREASLGKRWTVEEAKQVLLDHAESVNGRAPAELLGAPKIAEAAEPKTAVQKVRKAVRQVRGVKRYVSAAERKRASQRVFKKATPIEFARDLPTAERILNDETDAAVAAGEHVAKLRDEQREFAPYIKQLDEELAKVDSMTEPEMRQQVVAQRERIVQVAEQRLLEADVQMSDATGVRAGEPFINSPPTKIRVGTDTRGRAIYKFGWKRNGAFEPAGAEWDFIERLSEADRKLLTRNSRKGDMRNSAFGPDVIIENYRANAAKAGLPSPEGMTDAEVMGAIIELARERAQLRAFTSVMPAGRGKMLDSMGVPAALAEAYAGDVGLLFSKASEENLSQLRKVIRQSIEDEVSDHGRFATSDWYKKNIARADAEYQRLMGRLELLDQHYNRLQRATPQVTEIAPEVSGELFATETAAPKSNDMEDVMWQWVDAARETDAFNTKTQARARLRGFSPTPGRVPRQTKIATVMKGAEEVAPKAAEAPKIAEVAKPAVEQTVKVRRSWNAAGLMDKVIQWRRSAGIDLPQPLEVLADGSLPRWDDHYTPADAKQWLDALKPFRAELVDKAQTAGEKAKMMLTEQVKIIDSIIADFEQKPTPFDALGPKAAEMAKISEVAKPAVEPTIKVELDAGMRDAIDLAHRRSNSAGLPELEVPTALGPVESGKPHAAYFTPAQAEEYVARLELARENTVGRLGGRDPQYSEYLAAEIAAIDRTIEALKGKPANHELPAAVEPANIPTMGKGAIVKHLTLKKGYQLRENTLTPSAFAELQRIREEVRQRLGIGTKSTITYEQLDAAVSEGKLERVTRNQLNPGDIVVRPGYEGGVDVNVLSGPNWYMDSEAGGGSLSLHDGYAYRAVRSGLPDLEEGRIKNREFTESIQPLMPMSRAKAKLAEAATPEAPTAPVVEPAAAAAGGGAQPPVEPPTPAAAGGAGGDGGDGVNPMRAGAERSKLPVARGRRLEAQRNAGIAKRRLAAAEEAQVLREERSTAKLSEVNGRQTRLGKAHNRVAEALDRVDRAKRAEGTTEAFVGVTDEEKAAYYANRRGRNEAGQVVIRSQADRINQELGRARAASRAAVAENERLVDRIDKANTDIAVLEQTLSRSAQSEIRDLVHGKSRVLPLDQQGPKGPIKEGDWIELADGQWGRVKGENMVEAKNQLGQTIYNDAGDPKMEFDGWRVATAGGSTEIVAPTTEKGQTWRWTKDNRGAVGRLRRNLRGLRDEFGFITTKTIKLVDGEHARDLASDGLETTQKVADGEGVVWDTLTAAQKRGAKFDLVAVAEDLGKAANDAERVTYLTDNADRLGLTPDDIRAMSESERVDTKVAQFDAMVTDSHRGGGWLDVPSKLARLSEDLDFGHAEWQNERNKTAYNFKQNRVRALADDSLNVRAMPATWRPPAILARRSIRHIIDQATELSDAGEHAAANTQLDIAAEIATNMRDMMVMGVDPKYFVGGEPASLMSSSAEVSRPQITADFQRKTPFRPLTVESIQSTQLNSMVSRLRRQAYDATEQTWGKTISQIQELRPWLEDFVSSNGRYPTPDEVTSAARQAGWVPLQRGKGVGSAKVIDVAAERMLAVQEASAEYEQALASGDEGRIQRARANVDAAELDHQRAVANTPKVVRAAFEKFAKAQDKYDRLAAQHASGMNASGVSSVDPDVLATAYQAAEDARVELAAAEEASMPKLVPDTINREMRRDASLWDRGTLPGFKFLARTNRFYKNQVLPLSARWYINNTLGNVLMAGAYGGVGPLELFRTVREIRRQLKIGGVGERSQNAIENALIGGQLDVGGVRGGRISQSGLFEAERRGLGLADFDTKQARTRPGRALRKVTDAGYGVNEFFDNVARSGVYMSKMTKYLVKAGRNGMDLSTPAAIEAIAESAMRDTLKAMGDYSNHAPWQRKYLRQIFPFWSWIRHSTVAAMRLPAEHPMRAAWLAQLSVLANDKGLSGPELAFFSGRWLLGNGTSVSFGTLSPVEDPLGNPIFNPPGLLAGMAPALKIALAATTGLDVTRMQQVTRPPANRKRGAFGQQVAAPLMFNPSDLLGYTVGQVPLLRNLRDAVDGPSVRYGTGQPIVDRSGRPLPSGKSRVGSLASIFGIPFPEQSTLQDARQKQQQRIKLGQ